MSLSSFLEQVAKDRFINVKCTKCGRTGNINANRVLSEKQKENMRLGKRTTWMLNTSSGWYCPSCDL